MAEFGGHSIHAGAWEAALYKQGELGELHASTWRDLVHGAATTAIASALPMVDLGAPPPALLPHFLCLFPLLSSYPPDPSPFYLG